MEDEDADDCDQQERERQEDEAEVVHEMKDVPGQPVEGGHVEADLKTEAALL